MHLIIAWDWVLHADELLFLLWLIVWLIGWLVGLAGRRP
jgi:hypothetical protein